MVLRPNNFAKKPANENQPPASARTVHHPKTLVSRLGLANASHRRRSRASGMTRTSKYAIEQAKRRSDLTKKTTKQPVSFNVTTVPTLKDVDMGSIPVRKTVPVSVPKELARPPYKDLNPELPGAIDPTLADIDMEYLRSNIDALGPELMQSLYHVKINAMKDKLPKELTMVVNDMTAILPSHILAVFSEHPTTPSPSRPRKVTLFPVHSLVLAVNCAHLPKPPAPLPIPLHQSGEQEVTLPVWNMCLNSPETYPHLSCYLYTKDVGRLMASMLPCAPPSDLLENKGARLLPFATYLSQTFTVQALARHMHAIYGLWNNVCRLGVFDSQLWDVLDLMWEIILTALAIATGQPQLMIPPQQPEAKRTKSA